MGFTSLTVVAGMLVAALGTPAIAGDWDARLPIEQADEAPAIQDGYPSGLSLAGIKTRLTPQEFEALAGLAKAADDLSDHPRLTAGVVRRHTLGFEIAREPNGDRRVHALIMVKYYSAPFTQLLISADSRIWKMNYHFLAESDGMLAPEVVEETIGRLSTVTGNIVIKPLSDAKMQRYLQEEIRFWVAYANQRKGR